MKKILSSILIILIIITILFIKPTENNIELEPYGNNIFYINDKVGWLERKEEELAMWLV